jgi:hypothetical protein
MGWGDAPGASAEELASALAKFDPHGLAQALSRDEDHTAWFDAVCEALLPNYAYTLGWDYRDGPVPENLPVIAVRRGVPEYAGPPLPWPPGWARMWTGGRAGIRTRLKTYPAGAPSDVVR